MFNDFVKEFINYLHNNYNTSNVDIIIDFEDDKTGSAMITAYDKNDNTISNSVMLYSDDVIDKENNFKLLGNTIMKGFDVTEEPVNEAITDVTNIAKNERKDILVGDVYRYVPNYDIKSLSKALEEESKLQQIANLNPYCKVTDVLVTSYEDKDQLIEVTFDIPENDNIGLPDFARNEKFVVFDTDLIMPSEEAVSQKQKIEEDYLSDLVKGLDSAQVVNRDNPKYICKSYIINSDGAVELVCYDNEVEEDFLKYIGEPKSVNALKSLTMLLKDKWFEISDELFHEVYNIIRPGDKNEISESANPNVGNEDSMSQALLVALESEREAVATYEILIQQSTDPEEIELLNKILSDEKEHIALLSGLQSKVTASFVEEDNQQQLADYAEDTIQEVSSSENAETE